MWLSGDALIRGCRLVPRTLRLRKHPIGLALGMDFADEPLRLACRLRRGLPGKLLDLDSCRVERIESARTAARPGRRVRAATGRCPLSSMGASDGPQACHTPLGRRRHTFPSSIRPASHCLILVSTEAAISSSLCGENV